MDTLPALLFLLEQTRPGGPLALLADDGPYTHASACTVIMTRAEMPVQLIEGGFWYQAPGLIARQNISLYGVQLPADEGSEFVGLHGQVGVDAVIRAKLAHNWGLTNLPLPAGVSWEDVRLNQGSVPAEVHIQDEAARGERETQRQLLALIDQGVALVQARQLDREIPTPAGRPGPRL